MLRSVMVPADFSEEFELITSFVEGLKSIGVHRVVLAHVVEASGMEGPVIAAKVDKVRDRIRERTECLCAAGLECEVRVSTGDDPARELLAMATESYVDAVVMGTHGKGTLSKLIERSVSEEVVWHAAVPVLLVRYDLLRDREHPSEASAAIGREVIVSTDFSATASRAYHALLGFPSESIGTAYLLHSVDSGLGTEKLERIEQGAEFQLGNWAKMAEEQGISAKPVIRYGDAKNTILQEALDRSATFIIAGTRGAGPLQDAVVGSVSKTLIRQASCPVMIVP